jgi:dephospho-CoA kinase
MEKTTSEQIEDIRAQRAKLEEETLEERKERQALSDLQKETYGLENDKAILEAEREIGPIGVKIALVVAPDGRGVIVRAPELIRTKAFQAKKDPSEAELEAYITGCVVFPDKGKYRGILKDFPLVTSTVATVIQELGGASGKARAEK